ncbi:hypothetical protein ACHWQZ_G015637 [Mnemiopsis leidyi]
MVRNTTGKLVGDMTRSASGVHVRKLKAVDKAQFNSDLLDLISTIDSPASAPFENSVSSLTNLCSELLDEHAPLQTKTVSVIDRAPWFDKEYREYRKLRRKAEAKAAKKGASQQDKAFYRELCVECTNLATLKKKEYFKVMTENSKNNPRTLWQLVNKNLDRKQAKPLPDYTTNLAELSSDFNAFFTEKIEHIRSKMPERHPMKRQEEVSNSCHWYNFEPTNIEELKEIVDEAGIKCSPADILPLYLLRDNIEILLPLMVDLVNASLSQGSMDGVKLADIIPLLKGDSMDPNILKNFRPVSNLTFLGKLVERVVLRRLNEHLSRNNLNCPEQSAYKKHHSTETLLIRIWNDLLVAADEKSATVVMMLDLSAAFDTVDHNLLLNILEKEIGLRGNVLKWFTSFLKGRSQRIRLGSTTSDEILIKFGVPQGSVLGPVLFNLYIRSIYRHVRECGFGIQGYADDHQIMKTFKPQEQGLVLSTQLQSCFDVTKAWMADFYLAMNDSKTQIIVFGSTKVLNEISLKGVNLGGQTTVRFVTTVKNLGIQMDAGLTLDNHIMELKRKCFHTLRNLAKIRFLLSTTQLKTIVNSLVISCLDYCNGMFYGISNKLIHQLQLIQNACAKAITARSLNHGKLTKEQLSEWLYTAFYLLDRCCLPLMGLAVKQTTQIEQLKSDKIRDQEKIIQLQNQLIEKKDKEIQVVKDTVVSELKSYSSVVQESCSAALAPQKIVSAVKQVNQDVDRSRNIVVFGVAEAENENPEQKVVAILDKLEEKPQISGCVRIGQIKPGVVRPLRFRVRSQETVYQILRKASKLRNFEDCQKVFISPDRTVEERISRKMLVEQLKEKRGADPNNNYVIRKGEIVRVDRTPS